MVEGMSKLWLQIPLNNFHDTLWFWGGKNEVSVWPSLYF